MEKAYTKPELEVISLTSLSDFLMGSNNTDAEDFHQTGAGIEDVNGLF
jgi:hypothetical protein